MRLEDSQLVYHHRLALYGLGGIGKSQLALTYAYRNKEAYHAIFWISGRSKESLLSGFKEIGNLVNCANVGLDQEGIARAVLKWFRGQENWLLVIDNVNDITDIEDFLPSTNCTGHTLITTRDAHYLEIPAEGLEALPMKPEESRTMLLNMLRVSTELSSIRREADMIVEILGHLPSAIEQAVNYIGITQNIYSFLRAYNTDRKILMYTATTISSVWKADFERLNGECPSAMQLLQLFAFMDPEELSLEYLRAGNAAIESFNPPISEVIRSDVRLHLCLNSLLTSSLIRVFDDGAKFSVHPLVQSVIAEELDEAVITAIKRVIVGIGCAAFPDPEDPSQRETCGRFYPYAISCLEFRNEARSGPELLSLLKRVRKYCQLEDVETPSIASVEENRVLENINEAQQTQIGDMAAAPNALRYPSDPPPSIPDSDTANATFTQSLRLIFTSALLRDKGL
jgi:hypothetical protein